MQPILKKNILYYHLTFIVLCIILMVIEFKLLINSLSDNFVSVDDKGNGVNY